LSRVRFAVSRLPSPPRWVTILTGRVRQLKVRGYEEQAIQLVQKERAMPPKAARSWVKSI
jgi:hypothetical protein